MKKEYIAPAAEDIRFDVTIRTDGFPLTTTSGDGNDINAGWLFDNN